MCDEHHAGAPLPRNRLTWSRSAKVGLPDYSSEDAMVVISMEVHDPNCKEEQNRLLGQLNDGGMDVLIDAIAGKADEMLAAKILEISIRHGLPSYHVHGPPEKQRKLEEKPKTNPPIGVKPAAKPAPKPETPPGPQEVSATPDPDNLPATSEQIAEIRELGRRDDGAGNLTKALIRRYADVKPGKEGEGLGKLTHGQTQRILQQIAAKHPEALDQGFKSGSDVKGDAEETEAERNFPYDVLESVELSKDDAIPDLGNPAGSAEVSKADEFGAMDELGMEIAESLVKEPTKEVEITIEVDPEEECAHIWYVPGPDSKLSKCLSCGIDGTKREYQSQKAAEFVNRDISKAAVFDWIVDRQKDGEDLYALAEDLADKFDLDDDIARAALREYVEAGFENTAEDKTSTELPDPASLKVGDLRKLAKRLGIDAKDPTSKKYMRKAELLERVEAAIRKEESA